MSSRAPTSAEMADLRRRAEVMLGKMIEKVVPSINPENVEALVHELHVHQIELHVQCDELRRSRQEAEESRDRYRELYETAPGAYISLDPYLQIEHLNAAGERLLGLHRNALIGKQFSAFIADDAAATFRQCCRKAFEGPNQLACEAKLKSAGVPRTVLIDIQLVGAQQDDRHVRLVVTDITARKQAEDQLKEKGRALAESQKELQALSVRLLSMEQEIRKRTAHELQEEFSQRMTTLVWELSGLEQRHGLDSGVTSKLHNIKQRLSHIGVDLHHLAHRLHSGFLEHCELHVAMKEYIDDLNMLARPQILFEADKIRADCRPDQAVALFRVMQESLQNVFRHAEARSVRVALMAAGQKLVLTVRDDGKGFDTSLREKAHTGFGLIIMRERMRAVGGQLAVESSPRQGTTVIASVFQDR